MDWSRIQNAAAEGAEDLAGARDKNSLVFYLVSRFIVVLVAVVAVESAVVWLESIALLPVLQVTSGHSGQAFETTSAVTLLRWALTFVQAAFGSGPAPLASLAARSAAIGLAVALLLLLAIPLVLGALVFARLAMRKVRALQEQRERELAQIDRQRNQFITDIAHDLRTPLMAVSGMAHALSDGLVRDQDQRDEYLRALCEKSDKMGELVNAVFDYTKLGSESFELNRTHVDLAQLLLREAAAAYADAEAAGMQLTTCIPDERCIVSADPVQLARVAANLIANAVKHNPPGTEVSVLLVRQAGTAYALVADTGRPLTDDPDDLFQPFAQGEAARSHAQGGSGLGLSICKRVADLHGFDFGIAQPYGRFTKAFVLHCPLVS